MMNTHFESVVNGITALAQAYYYQGQLDAAIEVMEQGIKLCSREEIQPDLLAEFLLAAARLQATAIFMSKTSPDQTLETLERARTMTDDPLLLARADALTGLTHYYTQLGTQNADFSTGEQALEKVKSYGVELPPEWHSEWLFHFGLIYQNTDRIEEARDHFQRSYDHAKAHNLPEIQSFAVRHLGFIQQYADKNLDAARASFEESLRLREQINLKIYLPFSYQTLGAICMEQGDLTAAQTNFEQARASAIELDTKRALAIISLSLGELHERQDDIDKAHDYYDEARSVAESIGFDAVITEIEKRLKE